MKKALLILLALVMVFTISCRPQPDYVDYTNIYSSTNFPDWGTLFQAWWTKMSTNYVFWNLDDPSGTWWDDVYKKYLPEFQKFGTIVAGDTATEKSAQKLFFDICNRLSDGHYEVMSGTFSLTEPPAGASFYINPANYRMFRRTRNDASGVEINPSDEVVYKAAHGTDEEKAETEVSQLLEEYGKMSEETMINFIRYTLSKDGAVKLTDGTDVGTVKEIIQIVEYQGQTYPSEPRYEWQPTFSGEMKKIEDSATGLDMSIFNYPMSGAVYGQAMNSSFVQGAVGYLCEGILYFGFNGFYLSNAGLVSNGYDKEVINLFRELVTSEKTKGIIIDVRGNGGGMSADLSKLWSIFMNGEKTVIGQVRRKGGENRTAYGPWTDYWIPVDETAMAEYGKFNTEVPISVIINFASCSCAEITQLFFAALRDTKGYNVTLVGEPGMGGHGGFSSISEYLFNTGFIPKMGQILWCRTPQQQLRYVADKVNYEGQGYPTDADERFVYADFTAQTTADGYSKDHRLAKAIECLNTALASVSANGPTN